MSKLSGTLYKPEFDVDFKSAIKTMLGARNHELQLSVETAGQASQLDIPTQFDLRSLSLVFSVLVADLSVFETGKS